MLGFIFEKNDIQYSTDKYGQTLSRENALQRRYTPFVLLFPVFFSLSTLSFHLYKGGIITTARLTLRIIS